MKTIKRKILFQNPTKYILQIFMASNSNFKIMEPSISTCRPNGACDQTICQNRAKKLVHICVALLIDKHLFKGNMGKDRKRKLHLKILQQLIWNQLPADIENEFFIMSYPLNYTCEEYDGHKKSNDLSYTIKSKKPPIFEIFSQSGYCPWIDLGGSKNTCEMLSERKALYCIMETQPIFAVYVPPEVLEFIVSKAGPSLEILRLGGNSTVNTFQRIVLKLDIVTIFCKNLKEFTYYAERDEIPSLINIFENCGRLRALYDADSIEVPFATRGRNLLEEFDGVLLSERLVRWNGEFLIQSEAPISTFASHVSPLFGNNNAAVI
ncbi:hypothetical protein G9A89_010596 [Geosiphon pyriformis]|nr:hypothetical protein G9A89_010596 [Geosiphon pyriformis]